jgi:hypothetical protein
MIVRGPRYVTVVMCIVSLMTDALGVAAVHHVHEGMRCSRVADVSASDIELPHRMQ